MTKAELIKNVAEVTGITQTAAEVALNCLANTIINQTRAEGRFVLPGVGIFSVVEKKPRSGRNPKTGEPITIEAKKAVKFKAGSTFKQAVNT
jgi:DNA-binding protein HU-beta